MIGFGFLTRLIQLGFYAIIGMAALVFAWYTVTWALRMGWELFEANFRVQANWLRSKMPRISFKRRPKRRKSRM